MSAHLRVALVLLVVVAISAINGQGPSDNENNGARDKRTAPLILGFVAKKFGYQLFNQNDIYGHPDEIILRRVGFNGKPQRPKPFPQATFPQAVPPPPPPGQAPVAPQPQPQQQPRPLPQTQPQPQPQPQQPPPPSPPQQDQFNNQYFGSGGNSFPFPQYPQPSQQPARPLPMPAPVPQQPQPAPLPFPQRPQPAPLPFPQQPQPAPLPFPQQPQPAPLPFPQQPQPAPLPFPQRPTNPAPLPIPQRPINPPPQAAPQPPRQPIAQPPPPPPPSPPSPPPVPQAPQVPQFPQFPQIPQIPQIPQQPPTSVSGPANDIDLTEYQRKAPENEPNVFGQQNFNYQAINPRTMGFENFQFVSQEQQSEQPQPQEVPQSQSLAQQYEGVAEPSYDNDDVLLKGFVDQQQFAQQTSTTGADIAPTAASTGSTEGQYDFSINIPDQPQPEQQQQQEQPQQTSFEDNIPTTAVAPGYEQDQYQYQQQTFVDQQQPQGPVAPVETPGRNNFPQFQSQQQQQLPRGSGGRGKILNIDQLEFEQFGQRFQPQQRVQEVNYQPQSQFRSEIQSNRGSFNIVPPQQQQSSGQHNYDVQILRAIELPTTGQDGRSLYDQHIQFGARNPGAFHQQQFSNEYLPPLSLQNNNLRRRDTQGKGQSSWSMSFKSNDQNYNVHTVHQPRSQKKY